MVAITEPTTVAEVETRIQELKRRVAEMERQLLEPQRANPDGTVMTGLEYMLWRRRCVQALSHCRQELGSLRPLRARLIEAAREAQRAGNPEHWRRAFGRLYAFTERLERRGRILFTDEEQAFLAEMETQFDGPGRALPVWPEEAP